MALTLNPNQPKTLDNNTLLNSMLQNPIEFSKPIKRLDTNIHHKMNIVKPGPPSPPITQKKLVNGFGKKSEEEEEEDDLESIDEDDDFESRSERENGNGNVKKSSTIPNGNGQLPTPETTQPSSSTSSSSQSPHKASIPSQTQPQIQTPKPTPKQYQPKINSDDIHKTPIDLTWPESISSLKKPAAGLHNPSMACYANATLQVLLHTPPVLRICLDHDEKDCPRSSKNLFCMLCELRDMADGSHWSGRRAYAPMIHSRLKYIKKSFSKNRQEDTHEFFRFVTDALQATALTGTRKDLPEKIKHSSWVYKVWGGKVRSRVICSKCNKPSDTFDWFLDLSLDVNKSGSKSIKNMMNGFTREDKLEGDNKYHCDNCKAKANATKSFKIEEAPPILTLHLKRFSVDYNSYSGRARANKYNGPIEFSDHLDIAPYMVNPKIGGTNYRLFGVTCHRGVELRFGHYTSYVKGPQGQWFHADDNDMSPVRLSQVLNDKTAYLLSYIRIPDGVIPTPPSSTVKRVNGLVNGHSPSPIKSKIGEKRQRSDSDHEEEEEGEERVNVLKPKKSNNNLIGPQKPMIIRKGTPPSSKTQPTASPSPNNKGDSEMELPPELPSKFGSSMSNKPNQIKSKYQDSNGIIIPKPIHPGTFYSKSPIQRPSNPKPDYEPTHNNNDEDTIRQFRSSSESSRLSKKQRKAQAKKDKKNRMNGNPFKAGQLTGSDRSRQNDKDRKRSKFSNMRRK